MLSIGIGKTSQLQDNGGKDWEKDWGLVVTGIGDKIDDRCGGCPP